MHVTSAYLYVGGRTDLLIQNMCLPFQRACNIRKKNVFSLVS